MWTLAPGVYNSYYSSGLEPQVYRSILNTICSLGTALLATAEWDANS